MGKNILITPSPSGTTNPKIDFSGATNKMITLEIYSAGTMAFNSTGGTMLSVDDTTTGSLYSINDISGLPIFEVFSYDTIIAGTFNSNAFVVSGSCVGIGTANPTARLNVYGTGITTNATMQLSNSAGTANFTFLNNGYAGYGLQTPVSKLHIDAGTATASAIKFTANATTGQLATDGCDYGIDTAGNMELRQREALNIIFYSNNVEFFRISSAGTATVSGNALITGTTTTQRIIETTSNIIVGDSSTAPAIASAYYNTIIGGYNTALRLNTGYDNVIIGKMAASAITNGYQNVLIGTNIAGRSTGSFYDNVAIGNLNTLGGKTVQAYGCIALGPNALGGSQTNVGYAIGFGTSAGYNAGNYSIAIGVNTMYNMATINGVAIGGYIGYSTSLNYGVAIGYEAMYGAAADQRYAYYSVAIGYQSMYNCGQSTIATSGSNNSAFGTRSLYYVVGNQNTAVGAYAGYLNGYSHRNVYLGYGAGYSNYNISDRLFIANTTGATTLIYGEFDTYRVGIGYIYPSANLHIIAGTTTTPPLKLNSGELTSTASTGSIEFHDDDYYASITTALSSVTYNSYYPPAQNLVFVKTTTFYDFNCYGYKATDPTQSLIGTGYGFAWTCQDNVVTNQRFHIDLGSPKLINKIYYENMHNIGGDSNRGVKNFTLWGSNIQSAFDTTTYATDTNWTQITGVSQSTFDQHVAANTTDPKYITITGNTSYFRYYAFKFADNWGSASNMGVRRIELQSNYNQVRKGIILNDGTNLTPGTIPLAYTNGRLIDSVIIQSGSSIGIGINNPNALLNINNQTIGNTAIFSGQSGSTIVESDGTLRFDGDAIVYDDFVASLNVPAAGGAAPDIVNHTVFNIPLSFYCFDGGNTEERLSTYIEMFHGYKIGSTVEIHAHGIPTTNNSGTIVWYFDYFISPINGAPISGGTISASTTISLNTQWYDYTTSIGTISYSGLSIGDFIVGCIRRTPTNDTYPDDFALKQVAAHCEIDTVGSRQRYTK